jgi:hypothetical protein
MRWEKPKRFTVTVAGARGAVAIEQVVTAYSPEGALERAARSLH